MPELIIRVENLGKKYLIRHQTGGARYHALRDVLANGLKTGFGLFTPKTDRPTREEFWALKDVNFEVKEGEVVGIIGRNGSGKSTLLKILSRITEPTTGRVTLNGRVASLLEVGTGFHPELTGRENIYLNGSILGMSRSEIARKFDEIVAFAEVEKFLDTPVKRYSSGMGVRLGFAVAAHLEPEILVVDEVLAVGDAAFQKKCLGKMGEIARGGRTVLFVSHNMAAVESLCQTGVLLDAGRLVSRGPVTEIVSGYGRLVSDSSGGDGGKAQLSPELAVDELVVSPGVLVCGDPATVLVVLKARKEVVIEHLCVLIYSLVGVRVAVLDLRSAKGPYHVPGGQRLTVSTEVPRVNLIEGEYRVGLYVQAGSWNGDVYDLATVEVTPAPSTDARPLAYPAQQRGYAELEYAPLVVRVEPRGSSDRGNV